MRRLALASLILAATAPAVAAQTRQAFSVSMTECSVIYAEVARIGMRRGKSQEETDRLALGSGAFYRGALAQARTEGVPDPAGHVAEHYDRLELKWDQRMSSLTSLRENLDWLDYCRKFGRDFGILEN